MLASTEELHEKIQVLAYRVRTLEGADDHGQKECTVVDPTVDGLRESHAKFSSEGHPLLESELLAIKAPLQREPQASLSARSSPSAPMSDLGMPELTTVRVPRYEGSRYSASSPSSNEGDYDESVSVPLRRQSSRAHTPASALHLQVDRPAWTRRASAPQYTASRPEETMQFNQLSDLFPGSHDIFDTNLAHQLPVDMSMNYQYHHAKNQMNWDSNDAVFDMGLMGSSWNDFIPCN